MGMSSNHLEIEHKFLVANDFDVDDFCRRALKLTPKRAATIEVEDTYFITAHHPDTIFRHRCDIERQELTVKSRTGADTEIRMEVNLHLDQSFGNQRDAVTAFLVPFTITWQGTLHKALQVFYYHDCEVVFYTAVSGEQSVHCVEFEATGHGGDIKAARATLQDYETRLGFANQVRTRSSLFDLLLMPQIAS